MDSIISNTSRVLFIGAFLLAAVAILERLSNLFGFTLLVFGGWAPSRMLEYAAVLLLFVIALQLREIKMTQQGSAS